LIQQRFLPRIITASLAVEICPFFNDWTYNRHDTNVGSIESGADLGFYCKRFSKFLSSLTFLRNFHDSGFFLEAMDTFKIVLILCPTHCRRTVHLLLCLRNSDTRRRFWLDKRRSKEAIDFQLERDSNVPHIFARPHRKGSSDPEFPSHRFHWTFFLPDVLNMSDCKSTGRRRIYDETFASVLQRDRVCRCCSLPIALRFDSIDSNLLAVKSKTALPYSRHGRFFSSPITGREKGRVFYGFRCKIVGLPTGSIF